MSKQEFLAELRKGLSGLPQEDINERLTFYSEMIDDRIEEGLAEEDAVREIGSISEIVSQTITDVPLTKIVKERAGSMRTLRIWEIILLALGSPIWLSLLIAAFTVILAAYIVMWSVIISLWAIETSLAVCSLGGVVAAAVFAFQGNTPVGIAMLGAGVFGAGLAIFMFFGCREATHGILLLTKKMAFSIKSLFVGKENIK